MNIGKKYVPVSSGGTHAEVDAAVGDLVSPSVPLNTTGNLIRLGVAALLGYMIAK